MAPRAGYQLDMLLIYFAILYMLMTVTARIRAEAGPPVPWTGTVTPTSHFAATALSAEAEASMSSAWLIRSPPHVLRAGSAQGWAFRVSAHRTCKGPGTTCRSSEGPRIISLRGDADAGRATHQQFSGGNAVNQLSPISPNLSSSARAGTAPAEDRADQEKRAIIEILQLVTRTEDLHELAAALIAYIRGWTGCEAAALRVRRGEDFPFFATEGFPAKLLRDENSLCAFNENGEIIRDASGRPVLECICGCVLCGALGKHRPFLTEQGGFCVASSTQFVVEHGRNLPGNIRGKCVEQGYESIAIIPLRLDDEPYGLLHLCDRRRGLFDDSTLTVLERLADSLAVALAHREAQQAVRRHEVSLRALASRLAMTEEQERRRIATVLHDDLCQTLAFASMRLNSLRDADLSPEASAVTSEIEGLLGEAIAFTRDLTVELCPPVLYQSGLAAALEWLADRAAARHDLVVQCESDSACFTDAEVETIIFRSVRELLANIVKYAQATSVRIWMACTDDAVQIGVSDDGVGFDSRQERVPEANGGFGLFSIREALAHIGGHLEVHSSPSQGTTCILNVSRELTK
ncbi:MAG TPA: hypothetical protein DEP45_14160 [Armatimonadetes bacterium]|nr:hypothetical protein [Armatimonadota bacterium]